MSERPVILAIDQAEHSGWCVHYAGVWHHGMARKAVQRNQAVHVAFQIAHEAQAKLLVVLEDHSGMPLTRGTRFDQDRRRGSYAGHADVIRGTATILGMGAAAGRWLEQLELMGHSPSWTMRVEPREWRAKLIGNHGDSEAIKKRAIARASQTVGRAIEDHNEAEAIAIAEWAALDGVARFFGAREAERVRRRARG